MTYVHKKFHYAFRNKFIIYFSVLYIYMYNSRDALICRAKRELLYIRFSIVLGNFLKLGILMSL